MTSTPETTPASPWVSIWLSPRRTIDRIAAQPRQPVWPLAGLGALSGFFGQLVSSGFAGLLLDWRLLLVMTFAGAIIGIGWFYLAAWVYGWIAGLLGGRASAHEVRAAFAWSGVPVIVGFAVVVALFTAGAPSLPLAGVVAICGVWSFVVLLGMLSRVERFGLWRAIVAYVPVLIVPFLVSFLIRGFLFQAFNSPSQSMAPTLLVGDHFLASKYAYGYGPYSLPFPLLSGRIFGSEPARGDVVAFRNLRGESADYVKRVVGLPGDRIQMKQGLLYINGVPVERQRLADFTGSDACGTVGAAVKRWRETLPNGVSHETLDCIDNGYYDGTDVYAVPDGHYFMLGDNRDNSTDSRVLNAMGYVPLENIIGRAEMIFLSRESGPGTAVDRPERVGTLVR